MPSLKLKRVAALLFPPSLFGFVQRLNKRFKIWRGKYRVAKTLSELDREIATIDRADDVDVQLQLMSELVFDPGWQFPADPESPEYRQAIMDFYRVYSGRDLYDSSVNEQFEAPEGSQSPHRPFPYITGSSQIVGEHLMAIGFLMQAMRPRPGMTVLEFGPGWGNTTIDLARMGCQVTAVDVNPFYLELIRQRCQTLELDVELARSDMLNFRPAKRFDRILFFECFHHCSDPIRMLRQADEMLAPGGTIVFAAEPITPDFPIPWGLRTDGQSAYQIRKRGWLELGFNQHFFESLLARHGWHVERLQSYDQLRVSVFLASRQAARSQSRAA